MKLRHVQQTWRDLAEACRGSDRDRLYVTATFATNAAAKFIETAETPELRRKRINQVADAVADVMKQYRDAEPVLAEVFRLFSASVAQTVQQRTVLPESLHSTLDAQVPTFIAAMRGDVNAAEAIITSNEDLHQHVAPGLARGEKVVGGARLGHVEVHGTPAAREQRNAAWKAEIERIRRDNPAISTTEARRRIATENGVSLKTVVRATTTTNKHERK